MSRKVNWFGLAGGITTLLLIGISMFYPWWQFTLGEPVLLAANTSPLNTNFDFLSSSAFTIPLLWALNFASVLSMTAGGIIMLIYSLFPAKPYSMRLLSFAYRKPVYAVVFFVASLIILTLVVQGLLGIKIPLMGEAVVTLPQSITQIAIIHINVSANFLWPFWLAVIAASLCLIARIYHRKVAAPKLPPPPPPAN